MAPICLCDKELQEFFQKSLFCSCPHSSPQHNVETYEVCSHSDFYVKSVILPNLKAKNVSFELAIFWDTLLLWFHVKYGLTEKFSYFHTVS